jgi:hypothetical protein
MFQQSSDDEFERSATGGTRHLFALDSFRFLDVLDDDGVIHHFVLELTDPGAPPAVYRTDRATMYEMMARFLSGEHEKQESGSADSLTHAALLDVLEIARTWARSGKTDFDFVDLDDLEFEFDESDGLVEFEFDDEEGDWEEKRTP